MRVLWVAGQADAQDGPASNEPWIYSLDWHARLQFKQAPRKLWRVKLPDQGAKLCLAQCQMCQTLPRIAQSNPFPEQFIPEAASLQVAPLNQSVVVLLGTGSTFLCIKHSF